MALRVGLLGLELVTEFDGGCEEGAGFADRLVAAAQRGGPGAVSVAEQAPGGLGVQAPHVRSPGAGGKHRLGVIEGFDLLADGEVFLGDGPVSDPGVGRC